MKVLEKIKEKYDEVVRKRAENLRGNFRVLTKEEEYKKQFAEIRRCGMEWNNFVKNGNWDILRELICTTEKGLLERLRSMSSMVKSFDEAILYVNAISAQLELLDMLLKKPENIIKQWKEIEEEIERIK